MPQVTAPASAAYTLAAGAVLEVTANGGFCRVTAAADLEGAAFSRVVATGQTAKFGPYARAGTLTIAPNSGGAVYGSPRQGVEFAPDTGALWAGDSRAQVAVAGAAASQIAVAATIFGQSLPLGAVVALDAEGAQQKQYFTAPSQGIVEPYRLAPGASGSYFTPAFQQLGLEGIKVFAENAALGGMSLIRDACGVLEVGGWQANRAYRGKRASLGAGDPGTKGEFILESGRVWECTTGCTHLAFYDSDTPVTVAGVAWRRQLTSVAKNTDRTSANAKPVFSASAAVGDTVVDNGAGAAGGGVVWTCVAVAAPAADASGLRVARNADLYFDPYGALLRARTATVAQPVPVANRYLILVGTIQADAGQSPTLIRLAHQLVTTYMAAESVKTIHTMCLYYPTKTTADYDAYETVLSNAARTAPEDYGNSALTTNLVAGGYTRGIPGTTPRGANGTTFLYMSSLWRHFGTNVDSLLQTPQPNPHVTQAGALLCAQKWVPGLRSIFRNAALSS